MDNVIDFTPERIAKLRNLRPYKNKTDEEIIASVMARQAKPPKPPKDESAPKDRTYDRRFNEKMKIILKEFELDMNSSNDRESLNMLVRAQIQLEDVDTEINSIGTNLSKDDAMKLKTLGDYKRSLVTSITDLTDKLGISRKQRKEKAVDDIPQWIDGVLERAKTFFDGKTVTVDCPKDMVELFRYWENFPGEKNTIRLELTCWKCKEQIVYIG